MEERVSYQFLAETETTDHTCTSMQVMLLLVSATQFTSHK